MELGAMLMIYRHLLFDVLFAVTPKLIFCQDVVLNYINVICRIANFP
jgi:hypothetical protein